jgi:DNA-directed RNA polymerase subunit RPC12/RpoP
MEHNKTESEEIACPHCDAVYCLAGKNEHPTPYACKNCGRIMYDGRRKLRPGSC